MFQVRKRLRPRGCTFLHHPLWPVAIHGPRAARAFVRGVRSSSESDQRALTRSADRVDADQLGRGPSRDAQLGDLVMRILRLWPEPARCDQFDRFHRGGRDLIAGHSPPNRALMPHLHLSYAAR